MTAEHDRSAHPTARWLDKPAGAPGWAPDIDDDRSISRLWWLVGIVLVAGCLAYLVRGAGRPADPYLARSGNGVVTTTSLAPAPVGGRTPLAGFGEVAVSITDGGRTLQRCLLLAATEDQRARGLMEVTDPALGGYDGMLFRFDADVAGSFYMRNTPMPLSIAFLDAGGRLITALDMAPCGDLPDCARYGAARPYRYAVEVPQGRLPAVGLTDTAVLQPEPGPCAPAS